MKTKVKKGRGQRKNRRDAAGRARHAEDVATQKAVAGYLRAIAYFDKVVHAS